MLNSGVCLDNVDTDMDLHGKIMNLPCDGATLDWANTREAYMYGHRDARHAAAELATAADALIAELVEALKGMNDVWKCVCDASGWDPEHVKQYAAARDAIAKAEGMDKQD